ncbi:MAG: prophage endopeptidase tail [Chaetfec virus UA24_144]|nr:MAG: prophage endopeptidase tail [Chaetfec virus UA24_144]
MAYKIVYGDEVVYDAYASDDVYDAKMTAEVNTANYLDFTIAPNHPLIGKIKERDKIVKVYSDGLTLFEGVVDEIETDIYGSRSISCVGVLDYLKDTLVRPYSTSGGEGIHAPSTIGGYFNWLIQEHNKHALTASKRFTIGINQGDSLSNENYVDYKNSSCPTTASELESNVLDRYGGYLEVRLENGDRILDLYSDVHQSNSQIIDFGVNMVNFTRTDTTDGQYTALRPVGGTPDKEGAVPTTIASCGEGTTQYDSDIIKHGDVVYSKSNVARYGYKELNWTDSDTIDPVVLLKSAVAALKQVMAPIISIEVNAVDLSLYMKGYSHLLPGQIVRVRSRKHGIDEYLLVSSIDLDLQDPASTTYQLGRAYDTMTGEQSAFIKKMNGEINSSLDKIGALDQAVLDQAENLGSLTEDVIDLDGKVEDMGQNVDKIEQEVDIAKRLTEEAKQAAAAAVENAAAATEQAINAKKAADEATAQITIVSGSLETIKTTADKAAADAEQAKNDAQQAVTEAGTAVGTANKAQEDAAAALEEAKNVGKDLADQIETITTKMEADYAKKTDLTETEASLKSEISQSAAEITTSVEQTYAKKTDLSEVESNLSTNISQNAAAITSQATAIEKIDTTVNDAAEKAQAAQETANTAKETAAAAQTNASAANTAAQQATTAANAANTAANAANTAAQAAQSKADEAAENLVKAEHSLADLQARTDVAEEDILAAQQAVENAKEAAATAQTAADKAKEDAEAATATANSAASSAATAKTTAEKAQQDATTAQLAAVAAQAAADAAQDAVDELAVRVTKAETEIEQNAQEIALRATKEELKDEVKVLATKAELKVESDKISTIVSTTDQLDDRMSSMEQTTEGFNWSIGKNGIISTIDEFYNSTSPTVLAGGSWVETPPVWVEGKYIWTRTKSVKADNTVVYGDPVCVAGNSGEDGEPGKMLYAKSTTSATEQVKVNAGTIEGFELYTGVMVAVQFQHANTAANPQLNIDDSGAFPIFVNGKAMTQDFYWGDNTLMMFVYDGTNWTVADSAALTKADDAAKTATNFMEFTDDGLIVGDLTEETLTDNVNIKPNSIAIRNGKTVLADFSKEEINIGQNSSNAVINFCGGKGSLEYRLVGDRTRGSGIVLDGNAVSIESDQGYVALVDDRLDEQAPNVNVAGHDRLSLRSDKGIQISNLTNRDINGVPNDPIIYVGQSLVGDEYIDTLTNFAALLSRHKNATQDFKFLGVNPTGGTGSDTRAFWQDKGSGYAWISVNGQLNGQKNQWGFLINITYGAEVHQEFWSQSRGHWYRYANGNTGAMPTWRDLGDTDTGWIWSSNSGGWQVRYRKVQNIVFVHVVAKSGSGATNGKWIYAPNYLPAGYRPSLNMGVPAYSGNGQGNNVSHGWIGADGQVGYMYYSSTSGDYQFHATYPV